MLPRVNLNYCRYSQQSYYAGNATPGSATLRSHTPISSALAGAFNCDVTLLTLFVKQPLRVWATSAVRSRPNGTRAHNEPFDGTIRPTTAMMPAYPSNTCRDGASNYHDEDHSQTDAVLV